jgi:hypothetical protein
VNVRPVIQERVRVYSWNKFGVLEEQLEVSSFSSLFVATPLNDPTMGFSLLSQGGTREQLWMDLKKEHWADHGGAHEQTNRKGRSVLAHSGLHMRKTLISA